EEYALLHAGSALGFGVGPLLICRDPRWVDVMPLLSLSEQERFKVGIPGKYTTANFLLGLAYPGLIQKREMLFSDIENALLTGEIDLGVIIHENRFTYQAKGLHKVTDLGDYWEQTTSMPIPLGGIVVKRSHPISLQQKINRVLRRSVQFAFDHPESGLDFIRSHAQEMEMEVMYHHIRLYVNQYSLDLGENGRSAIAGMYQRAEAQGLIPS